MKRDKAFKMRKFKLHIGKKGFSLIELLVAVCILAVAAIPMLKSFISSFYANAKARERLTAVVGHHGIDEAQRPRVSGRGHDGEHEGP